MCVGKCAYMRVAAWCLEAAAWCMCSKICLVANLQRASYIITKHFSISLKKKKKREMNSQACRHFISLLHTHTRAHNGMLVIIFQVPYPTAPFFNLILNSGWESFLCFWLWQISSLEIKYNTLIILWLRWLATVRPHAHLHCLTHSHMV